jgi:hypothetical protein
MKNGKCRYVERVGRAKSVVEKGRLEYKGLGHEIEFKHFNKNGLLYTSRSD